MPRVRRALAAGRNRPCREHSTTRRTCRRRRASHGSSGSRWNERAGPSSSSVETACLWRSRLFGVITISGLRKLRRIWRRSRWKYLRRRGAVARPACCPRRTAAGSARGGRASAPAPGLRSRAAAACTRPRHAQPLRFAGADELVDDDLRAVGEVAELGLPDHQRVAARPASSRTRSRAPPPRTAGCR